MTTTSPSQEHPWKSRLRWGVMVAVCCLVGTCVHRVESSQWVSNGISLGELGLGGLAWEKARSALAQFIPHRLRRRLAFSGDTGICTLSLADVDAKLEFDRTWHKLEKLSASRRGLSGWLRAPDVLRPELSVDQLKLQTWLDACESRAVANRPVQGRLIPKDGDFVIQPSRAGRRIDRGHMLERLAEAIGQVTDTAIALPVVDQPELPSRAALERARSDALELTSKAVILRSEATESRLTLLRTDLTKMLEWKLDTNGEFVWQLARPAFEQWLGSRRHRVERRARDATYETDRHDKLSVVQEQKGSRIAMDQLLVSLEQSLRGGNRQLEIPFEPTEVPKRVVADLEPLNIHEAVGSFTTRHACCQPRVTNIHRIADLINGTIVLPGETFSVNEKVGQRSLENGFVPAPGIEDGEMVDSIGGGVSQFATTFYNAVMRAGYEVLERQAHSYWFDRYPMGHEATLSWPKPDLVFRNDSQVGLLILASYTERSVTIRLFGHRDGRRVDVSVSPRFDIIRPAIEYLPNSELESDKEHVKEGGCIGWSVWTMRTVTLKDGSTKKDKRKVVYKPRTRRVEVHPCKIPKGEPGHTGEACPKPSDEEEPVSADSAPGTGTDSAAAR